MFKLKYWINSYVEEDMKSPIKMRLLSAASLKTREDSAH